MFARVKSLGLLGIDGFLVDVEADLSQGLPGFDVVGLPGTAVRESRDRVRAAMKNGGFTYPVSRITVNLAPADIKKEGSIYDLPLFLALLRASGQLKSRRGWEEGAFLGELSLTGEIRPVRGVLPMVIAARDAGLKQVFVPAANAAEGAIVEGIAVYPAADTAGLLAHLNGEAALAPARPVEAGPVEDAPAPRFRRRDGAGRGPAGHGNRGGGFPQPAADRAAGVGQEHAGQAAALHPARHEPPRRRWRPPKSIRSRARCPADRAACHPARPFRAPHHSISAAGLTRRRDRCPGLGRYPWPTTGCCFWTSCPSSTAMAHGDACASRWRTGGSPIARVRATGSAIPARFMLVAAMNPCPCGYFGHPSTGMHLLPRRRPPATWPGYQRPAARPDGSA